MEKQKVQYSKALPFVSFVLFCICLIKSFSVDISNAYDLSIYVSAITASGSICLTSIVWYLKNSQAEKVARIKADTYRIASEERLKYNKAMMELKQQYNCSDEDVASIENDSPMDEFESEALNSLETSVDSSMDEATTSIESQVL
jgi:hypothetical protein